MNARSASSPPRRPPPILRAALLTTLIALTGCLPHGCQRRAPNALLPADSLSRQTAAEVTPDTLVRTWTHTGPEAGPLSYPSTIARSPAGDLWVADAQNAAIYRYAADGSFRDTISVGAFSYPFLAGFRGDTLLVVSRGTGTLHFVRDGAVRRSIELPEGDGLAATAARGEIFVKSAGSDSWWSRPEPGYVARLTARGERADPQVALEGPIHAHRGFLRSWGDTLLSLSGYRPAIDVLLPNGRLDTLRLEGFDSPMLARRRAFRRDEVDTPPLLTSSAVPLGDHLYVLNLRTKHLRVDVYDREGRLQRVLVEPPPEDLEAPDYFPLDLAVYRGESAVESLRIVVVTHRPEPAVRAYAIRPGGSGSAE